jgi:hypothetical protein
MTEQTVDDPFSPASEHQSLLQDVRERARTDAVRHAEDLLGRDLPIVEEVEAMGTHRVVRLGLRRQELIAAARDALAAAAQQRQLAEQRLRAALAALAAEGVPQDQLALEALDRPLQPERIAAMFGAATLAAAVAGGVWLGALGVMIAVLVCLACATALGVAVCMPSAHRAETARLSALRRERRNAELGLSAADDAHLAAERALADLPGRALRLLEGELAFVKEFVSLYESEVFRTLPPGALADGRGLGRQREPEIDMPGWAREEVLV